MRKFRDDFQQPCLCIVLSRKLVYIHAKRPWSDSALGIFRSCPLLRSANIYSCTHSRIIRVCSPKFLLACPENLRHFPSFRWFPKSLIGSKEKATIAISCTNDANRTCFTRIYRSKENPISQVLAAQGRTFPGLTTWRFLTYKPIFVLKRTVLGVTKL